MKKTPIIIFDFSDTLVKMRPPKLLIKRRTVAELSEKARLGIITGGKKAETNNILDKLKIRKFFNFVLTRDDSCYQKPDKKLVKQATKNLSTRQIVYIGDTKKDFLLAKNSKIDFCFVGKLKLGLYQSTDPNEIIKFIVKNYLR